MHIHPPFELLSRFTSEKSRRTKSQDRPLGSSVSAIGRQRLPNVARLPQRSRSVLLCEDGQGVARDADDVPSVVRRHIADRQKRRPRIGWPVEAVQIGQITQADVDPLQAPTRKVIAPSAGPHVRDVEGDVETLVDAGEVALIAPDVKALAGNALVKGGKRRYHIELRIRPAHRQPIRDQTSGLLLNAHLELVIGGQEPARLRQLGRGVEVAANDEDVVGKMRGHGRVRSLGPSARAFARAHRGQADLFPHILGQNQIAATGSRSSPGLDLALLVLA